jgi:hypothetical protein
LIFAAGHLLLPRKKTAAETVCSGKFQVPFASLLAGGHSRGLVLL